MKKIIYLIIFLLPFSSVISKYSGFNDKQLKEIFPSQTRFVYSLSGTWDFSSNNSNWERIQIPNVSPKSGRLIYQRQFKIERSMLEKFDWSLHFLGVSNQAEIYVNEQFIGKYVSNGIPFNVDIPKKVLAPTNNVLKIIVNNNEDGYANTLQNDIYSPTVLSGIPKDIFLIGMPQLHILNLYYTTSMDKMITSARVNIKAEIRSKDLENLARISITDSLGNRSVTSRSFYVQFMIRDKSDGSALASSDMFPFSIEPQRTITKEYRFTLSNFKTWSVDFPNLYEVVCKIYAGSNLLDENSKNFAFRNLTTNGNDTEKSFLFNGTPFKFKGVYYIENLFRNGNYSSPKRFEEDFKQLKILGINSIIFKYNYPSTYLLNLCDKYGFLAFIDLPLYNTPDTQIGSETVISNISNQAKNILSQYSSFPSVVAFGLGVGLNDKTSYYAKFSDAITKIFKENSDKLIFKTIYSENELQNNKNFDFLLFRSFQARRSFEDINNEYSELRNIVKPLPLVMTFGVPIQNKNHDGFSNHLSVEFQGYYIQNLYKISLVNNGFGAFYADFNDYFTQNPILSTKYIDEKILTQGLIDLNNKTKFSFNVLKALFNEETEPLVDIGNYSSTVYTFIVLSLLLIILFFMLFSRFRRFQEYFVRALLRPYNFYSDIRDQRILSPMFTYILGTIIALTFGIFTESLFYFYKTSEIFQYLLALFVPNQIALAILFKIIWIPIVGIIVFALLYLILIYIIALIIRLFAYIRHLNIHHFDVMNITIWGSLPIIFLLPFDIVLFKLLQLNSGFISVITIASVLIFLLSIFRILKATAVLFDANFTKVYLIGVGVFALLFMGFYMFYQYQTNFLSSLSYYFTVLAGW